MRKKVFISFDYEGIAGVSEWKETIDSYRFNSLATKQLNSFIDGVLDVYPDAEITVCDSHAKGTNIIWEELHPNVNLIKGYPRNFYMVEGLDGTFTDFVLFGYHSPIGFPGNMDHTYSASSIHNLWINEKVVGESEINTYVSSYYNVPLKFFYADSEAINWMKNNVSNRIEYLVSKETISRFSAKMYPLDSILSKLRNAGRKSLSGKGFTFSKPEKITMKIELSNTNLAYGCSIIPNVKLLDSRTIEVVCDNAIEMYKYLMTIIAVSKSLNN